VRASQTGFVKTPKALEYALVQDAPGGPTTAAEIHRMDRWDRYLTAMLRARFYQEKNKGAKQAGKRP